MPWYDEPIGRRKLWTDQEAMRERYPQFVLKRDDATVYWDGILQSNFDTRYRVRLTYPAAFPSKPYEAWIGEPELRDDAPHRYRDGSLCVHREEAWDWQRHTAAATVTHVAKWIARYELWLRGVVWS